MIKHAPISLLIVSQQDNSPVHAFCSYLQSIKHLKVNIEESLPDDLRSYDVVVTTDAAYLANQDKHLEQFVMAGGGWLCLVNLFQIAAGDWCNHDPGFGYGDCH